MSTGDLHILVGWGAAFFGVLTGGAIGLFFDKEEWAGGYGSFRRRMLRLGHISFFGLGFLNFMFGLTVQSATLPIPHARVASFGFLVGVTCMPLCCFLTAWKKPFRYLFPLPVLGVLSAITLVLLGWMAS